MTSLSQSELWTHMKDYYEQMGLEVWEDEVVPLDITSNVYLAKIYSRLIISAILDQKELLEDDEPFNIIELGVGHGKFSFYLLKKIIQALNIYQIPTTSIRYIMTDISMKNIEGWRANKAFAPYIEQGILDFAFYNALDDNQLVLLKSKETISPKSLTKPLFLVANYLFDSLPHDAFEVRDGQLYEVQLNLKGKLGVGSGIDVKDYFAKADFDFSYNPISGNYYQKYPELNEILNDYTAKFDEASFTLPIGGIQCIHKIKNLTQNALVLLVSDKGVANSDFFNGIEPPDITIHGSFSMTVNYDSLSQYTKQVGGLSLMMDNKNADFQVACLVFNPQNNMHQTQFSFNTSLSAFSPVDLYNLCYTADLDQPNKAFQDLDEILALLNLSQWDPNIFYDYHEIIIKHLEDDEVTSEQEAGLMGGVEKVWDYFFLLEKSRDIPFAIGCILYELEHFEQAICYFDQSNALFGEEGETYLNISLCHQNLDQGSQALAMARKAIAMDDSLDEAQKIIQEYTAN